MVNTVTDFQLRGGVFNTLVPTATKNTGKPIFKEKITVKGNGSLIINSKALNKRAKKKMIAQKISLALVDIAKKKGEKELEKSFWNTYYCQNNLMLSEGVVYGDYCKNRWCPLCNGNRSAEQIRKYLPILNTWEDPYFVTLTAKSVSAYKLKWMVKAMLRAFRLIVSKYTARQRRGKAKQLSGIRVMESNFNVIKRTYNVHFHLLVPNEEIADIFINEWLAIWSRKNIAHCKYVYFKAQDKRPVWNRTKGLREVLKYSTKIFTPEDIKKKKLGMNTPHKVYVMALYNIICAFRGRQIFDTFGDCKADNNKPRGGKTTVLIRSKKLVYKPHLNDWVCSETNNQLSGYLPDPRLAFLLDNINTEIE